MDRRTFTAALPWGLRAAARPRNIVLILSDDHRWDAMSAMGHPFLETPAMDRLAREGVHFRNAFVTTSLCSPSRATILTGTHMHTHGVVDNNNADLSRLDFFPRRLQAAGYETAFLGKWHMGGVMENPQPGFDHWISFRGQGSYHPSARFPLNRNGARIEQRGYITDELTGYALEWLNGRGAKPFFLMLSHKAVHGDFIPAARHAGRYANVKVTPPPTQADTPENYHGKPRWVKTQRNSTHGVDFPDQRTIPLETNYRKYCEAILALDESIGRVLDALERRRLLDSTLVLYLSDNGYAWGEHGLQDKRTAYEESIRVPMLARCPELFSAGTREDRMTLNLDIAPTMLAAAGLEAPPHLEGRSFLDLPRQPRAPWRDHFLYEYYWERNYPQTPTIHAIRTERYKYIRYHGVWDTDELYDVQADPLETRNLIAEPRHKALVQKLHTQLEDALTAGGGLHIRLNRDMGRPDNLRREKGSPPGEFPPWMIVKDK